MKIKNNFLMILIIFVFLIGSVYAISTDMKTEYKQGETIITEIGGLIVEGINKEQVDFKRKHVSVPFDFDLKKLGNKWFIWAITPFEEENYTLVIEKIVTEIGGEIINNDFVQNFSVIGNKSDYTIRPGFISTKDDFSVNIKLNKDLEKIINVDFPEEREILLKPGNNKVEFSIADAEKGVRRIIVGEYNLPVYIHGNGGVEVNDELTVRFNPKVIVSTILVDEKKIYPFKIVNYGKKDLENLRINYNSNIFNIDVEDRINLGRLEDILINLELVGNINDTLKVNGINEKISVNLNEKSVEFNIQISFTEKVEEVITPYQENIGEEILYYCSELDDGIICTGGEVCEGSNINSFEGSCCIGTCIKNNSEGYGGLIGWFLAVIGLALVIFLLWKYKKSKKGKDPLNRRVNSIEAKMHLKDDDK